MRSGRKSFHLTCRRTRKPEIRIVAHPRKIEVTLFVLIKSGSIVAEMLIAARGDGSAAGGLECWRLATWRPHGPRALEKIPRAIVGVLGDGANGQCQAKVQVVRFFFIGSGCSERLPSEFGSLHFPV